MMDLHVHTTFSDGKDSVSDMLGYAVLRGIKILAITDHFDPNDYRKEISGLTLDSLFDHFAEIRVIAGKAGDIDVLCGIETSPGISGKICVPKEVVATCDVIITSCHYIEGEYGICPGHFFNDDYWNAYKRYMIAMAAGDGDILGHMEGYLPIKPFLAGMTTTYAERQEISRQIVEHYCDDLFVDKIIEALKFSGKSCELHCATETPRESVIEKMAHAGITFTFGSDAHSISSVGRVSWACSMAKKHRLVLRTEF